MIKGTDASGLTGLDCNTDCASPSVSCCDDDGDDA